MTGISSPMFEVRLENEVIVLHGVESEAANQVLKGVLVLHLTTPLKVENICLQMTGKWKVGWNDRVATAWVPIHLLDKSTEIFNYKWPPFLSSSSSCSSKGTLLMAGKYEWPFETEIRGCMSETIEGLANSYVLYTLKASITKCGLGSAIHDFKPVRIVRALDLAALGLAGPRAVAGTWTDKIEYLFSVPQSAVAIGNSITMNMSFRSLLRDLRIGLVRCVLYESQEYTLSTAIAAKGLKRLKPVDSWNLDIVERYNLGNRTLDRLEEYALDVVLPLPNRLSRCVQDADVHGIRIRHMVKASLELYNPDGHISELRATLPITIFIPPNVIVDSNGYISQNLQRSQAGGTAWNEPPLYCEYNLDEPYIETGSFPTSVSSPRYRDVPAELPADAPCANQPGNGGIHGYDANSASSETPDFWVFRDGQFTARDADHSHLGSLPPGRIYSQTSPPPLPSSELPPNYEDFSPVAFGGRRDELQQLSAACTAGWDVFEPERVELGAPGEAEGCESPLHTEATSFNY